MLASDPQWLALMKRAVHAPKYDSYSARRSQLGREVWSREPFLSPALVLKSAWAGALPDPLDLKTYTLLQIREAQATQTTGKREQLAQAEQALQNLNAFGQRMAGKGQIDFEQLQGLDSSRESLLGVRALYAASKNTEQEQEISRQLGQIDARRAVLMNSFPQVYETYLAPYRRKALILRVCLAILFLSGLAIVASLLLLETGGRFFLKAKTITRRAACFAVDYAPIALILVSAGFIYSFRPFAIAFEDYRVGIGPFADPRFLTGALFGLQGSVSPRFAINSAYFGWWAATLLLALSAVFIIVRGFLRRKLSA